MPPRFAFGDFELDPDEWRLTRGDAVLGVQQKVLDLLATLCREPGSLHTREALHEALWPDVRVSEDALFQVVRKARSALGDEPRRPRFIETVPGRGYRFIAEVRQVGAPTIPSRPAPAAHRLPVERDTFVGRTADLEAVEARLVGGARLVTLVGPGGTGKTRLAIRLGWRLREAYPGGVTFCDLSEARGEEGVLQAVARALQLPMGDEGAVQLARSLAGRGPSLWILDNVEQVADAVARLARQWLDTAPQAALLATSREVIGIAGEETISLAPLEPSDALAMFATRAAAARRDFVLTDANRSVVEELVELLDRLPLAIELAAARIRVWSPETLLARMSDRFRVLTAGGRRVDRQATLQATLDWGWALLSERERSALGQLAVFEGGFDLDAAEAVLDLGAADGAGFAMDVVQDLVDRSWIQVQDHDRMTLLLSVQDYVRARVTERRGAEARHAAWFARLATEEVSRELAGFEGAERRRAIMPDFGNIEVATRRSLATGDLDVATRCLFVLTQLTGVVGPTRRSAELADALLGVAEPTRDARAVAGLAFFRVGRLREALARFMEARAAGPTSMVGNLDYQLVAAHLDLGDLDAAQVSADRALSWARAHGDRWVEGLGLSGVSLVACHRAAPDARERLLEAAAHHRDVGQAKLLASTFSNLALLATYDGNPEAARRYSSDALELHRSLGNLHDECTLLANLGLLEKEQGNTGVALFHLGEAQRIAREVGNPLVEGNVLANLGGIALDEGRLDDAERHLSDAGAIHAELTSPRSLAYVEGLRGRLDLARGDLQAARSRLGAAIDRLAELEDPVGVETYLRALADLEEAAGDPERARQLLARATPGHVGGEASDGS